MRRLILLLAFAVVFSPAGCKKKADSEESSRTGSESETQPPESPTTIGAREMRVTSREKIIKAFVDNPQRARKAYTGIRWRMHVRIDDINASRLIIGVIHSGDVGSSAIVMRTNREVEKLSRSKPAIIEATVVDYLPGTLHPMHFDDGAFIEQAGHPKQEEPLEGTRELTAASLNEMIETFDRGQVWASRYREVRWSFSGTYVKGPGQFSSKYIVTIPEVGKVEVQFPGGERPKVADRIDLDAVATRLTVRDDDKPLLVFSARKQRK